MSTTPTPPPAPDLATALRQFGHYLTRTGHNLAAHSALGALLADDFTTARNILERLPASYLDQLAPIAAELAALARHTASLQDRT
jgi:hypothetical protein